MCTTDHKFRDLNRINSLEKLDFRGVRGSIRLGEGEVVLRKESDRMIREAKKLKF